MKGKKFYLASFLVLLTLIMASVSLVNIYAKDERKVKVGFFPMEGYHEIGSDGSYCGMDVKYMEAIQEYAQWDVEFVICDSWEDALLRLENKEIDLVGSAQYSEERAKKFDYADMSSGYTFGVIATKGDSSLAYEDFEAIKNATIGMVKGYVRSAEFYDYMMDNGIGNPTVIEYTSTSEMHAALEKGDIQAYVHTFTEVKDGHRLIGRFAPRQFYYITYKGNDVVLAELNQAIADLKLKKPDLETQLMNEFYYSRFDNTALLTTEEKQYIIGNNQITVGYITNNFPFTYKKNGKFAGLTSELLDEALSSVGMSAEYIKYNCCEEALAALEAGEIQVLSYNVTTSKISAKHDYIKVCDYSSAPLVVVLDKGSTSKDIEKLATVDCFEGEIHHLIDGENVEVILYDSQEECLNALRDGDVSAALCDGYYAENLLKRDYKYNSLKIESVLSGEYNISMLMNVNADVELQGILSKVVGYIEPKEISEFMLKESEYRAFSFGAFIQENSYIIIAVLIALMIIVVLIARHIIKDSIKIQKLMYKDGTFDIWNLNYLIFWGEKKLLPEAKKKYAVVYINVAQFRRYNIIYGWNAGEKILKCMVDVLKDTVDKNVEICARQQGDRFCMLLAYDDENAFIERLQSIKEAIEKKIQKSTENKMKILFGVYFLKEGEEDLRLAGNYANQALEYIIGDKKEAIKIYDENLQIIIKERHEKEKLLEAVDVNKDFLAFYQSKVDIRTGKIVGAEALVRFADPTDGGRIKAPGYFVPYYEQTGRIIDIDFFVFESVCKLIRKRLDEGKPVVVISCNFSRMHFVKSGFAEKFAAVLEKYNIPKELIEIEITETLVVEELQHNMVKKTLEIIKEKGFKLSIDDFGAGYSSLGVFEQIPASVIKLDRSFLLNQEDRDRQVKIMRGIVKLTNELEAQVVCEGVENENDVELMKEIGAYVAQGYFYSKPIPESDFEALLDENHKKVG